MGLGAVKRMGPMSFDWLVSGAAEECTKRHLPQAVLLLINAA
jgi:hypothetical protein